MNRKRYLAPALAAVLLVSLGACGDDGGSDDNDTTVADTVSGDTAEGDTTVADTSTNDNPPPALGTLIDRLGRPGVATALIGTFNPDDTAKGATKDSYNEAERAGWADFTAELAANLAIYDAADTTCGNQLLAGEEGAARYATLAGALTDDRLYLNTEGTTCTTYLAVEADATGLVANDDCGGRALGYDVIDITYSALAIGALSGVGDGVPADDGTVSAEFPYLAAPGPAWPSPPTLGGLVDRLGRPGVSTALIGTFNADDTAKGGLKDDFNQAERADWPDYTTELAANLAIYDAADTTCGNQLLAGDAGAGRYATLAGALTDDRLYLNTEGATCTTYLAVEADATDLVPNDDCGGRGLGYDVIDITYSALAVGALSGVGDGVDADDATVSSAFPFLADPAIDD